MAIGSKIRNGFVKFFFNKQQIPPPSELSMKINDSFLKKYEFVVENFITEDNITSITYHGIDITSSYVRTWHDKKSKIPYKYEFRGNEFQGYLNPSGIVIVRN